MGFGAPVKNRCGGLYGNTGEQYGYVVLEILRIKLLNELIGFGILLCGLRVSVEISLNK